MVVRAVRSIFFISVLAASILTAAFAQSPTVTVLSINGTINPATDDYLRSGLKEAQQQNSQLVLINLNTPGGLVASMQSMVQQLLQAPIPTVVYVTPGGASATSAGVFITMAAHVAVMAPGTTIGAAHPVADAGQDIKGDSRAKVENFAASLIKAIAEQRNRNALWAEKAVRESVSVTDKEAINEKIIDLVAENTTALFSKLKDRSVKINSLDVKIPDLTNANLVPYEMSFKLKVVNILSDPNITVLIGLGAMAGLGIELYNPGLILPGVIGVICLVLSLTGAQVLPIDYGGAALLILSLIFFGIELVFPGVLVWGLAGIVCLVLGSIYLIDTDQVWGLGNYAVDYTTLGGTAGIVGTILVMLDAVAVKTYRAPVMSSKEGMVGKSVAVKENFKETQPGIYEGRVELGAEIWNVEFKSNTAPTVGENVVISDVSSGLKLKVRKE